MTPTVGLLSLAPHFPRTVRTNDHWRTNHPELVASAEQRTLAKLWSAPTAASDDTAEFDAAMAPYLADPFRGAVERRVLAADEPTWALQVAAARAALDAAGVSAAEVGLAIVSTFYPERLDVGNAVFVARELGMRGAAWNLETACAGSVVGLSTAAALVRAGDFDNVLVVVACRYSHVVPETDSLSWFLADGAGAFVVGHVGAGEGVLGSKTVHTADTCGVFFPEMVVEDGAPRIRMRADARAGRVLRESSKLHLVECCEGAAARAGVSLADVDFFVFNTPTAWFAEFAAAALGVDPARTLSTYRRFANVGPALMPANLHAAARAGRVRRGDVVLVYGVGSVSSASAVVMRWGEVALGPDP